ncbi:hypothetical protein [Streptomyces alkaliterrae]|uniref:Uncharacterized protein n=1 Tax=Streptomyces alkaliterrae TaxID=2213162 RepID=A0A5P0YT80_9ACTN|nr:hypothetical protein [Streptomyces alkaliterrae]MBB1257431.1 hypothetical protein [Streptomyces alkaliterrae]MQS02827.1 hypothetical protein [Streptomyces alkaliterrae]
MGTPAWQYARSTFIDIFRRRRGEGTEDEAQVLARLDSLEQAVAAVEPDKRPLMAEGVQAPVRDILTSCVGDQPEALQELIDGLKAQGVETPMIQQQTVTRNRVRGSINVAGRDNNFGGGR